MIITYSDDARTTNAKNLDTTGFRAIVECASKEVKTLESLVASCGDTTTDFTLVYFDGTTNFIIANEEQIAANDRYVIPQNFHLKLKSGQSLKAKASNADQVCVIAVTIDAFPKKADNDGRRPGA